ncbi:UDP-glycosyltransferase family 303 member A1 [Carabus blaptoides fortunei]
MYIIQIIYFVKINLVLPALVIKIMPSKYFVSRILALFTLGNMCQCANILYLSTVPSPSHNIWDKTLAMGLAGRNHKITYFTHSPEKPTENFAPIFIEGMYERLAQKFDYKEWLDYSTITIIKEFFGFKNMTCAFDLESKALRTLLAQAKNGVKYDLIIIDQNAGHCLYPLIDMFGSPPVIDYKNITTKNVLSAINEVRNNEVYKKNAQAISRYYRDKPQDALETAIFWVEYVLRHGGAEHLSIAARDMPFYQLLLLDILAIVTLTLLLVIFLVKQVIKSVKRKQKVKKH